jgi:hypothetical protein
MSTEWIERQNAATQRAAADASARNQQAVDAGRRIANQGPEVFLQFVRELKVNTDALPNLLGEELSGSTSAQGTTSCQVNVTWHNIRYGPNIVSWNFHYSPQGIRLVVWDEPELLFHFRLSHDGEVGIGYGDNVLTPEKMAELTVQQMRERARTTR